MSDILNNLMHLLKLEKIDDLTKLEIEDKALELFRKSTNVQNNDFILSIKNNLI